MGRSNCKMESCYNQSKHLAGSCQDMDSGVFCLYAETLSVCLMKNTATNRGGCHVFRIKEERSV